MVFYYYYCGCFTVELKCRLTVLLFEPPAVTGIKTCNFLPVLSPRQVDQLKYIKAFSTARLLCMSLCQVCSVNIIFAVNQQLFGNRGICYMC